MTDRAKQLLAEVLSLPAADRAALVEEAAASLTELVPDGFDPEWLAELERRAAAARADRAGATIEQVEARLLERLGPR